MTVIQDAKERGEYCPICKTLPFEDMASGNQTSALEFRLDDATMMELMNPDIEKKFSPHCALYSFARSVHQGWLEKDRQPPPFPHDWKRAGYQCHDREPPYFIFVEPNSIVGNNIVSGAEACGY